MSVPELERRTGTFETTNRCLDLCVYTFQITKNESVFLPEFQDITNDIRRLSKSIYTNALTANNIRVNSEEDFHIRYRYQSMAIAECNELLADINVAKKIFHLKTKRMTYWANKITACRDMLKKWRAKDKERFLEQK